MGDANMYRGLLILLLLAAANASTVCDLKAYLGTAVAWTDPSQAYRLPAIDDIVEGSTRWRFGWRLLDSCPPTAQSIGHDSDGWFLELSPAFNIYNNDAAAGYCALAIAYPANFDPTATGLVSPIYPCQFGSGAWLNNRIYYNFHAALQKNNDIVFDVPPALTIGCELAESNWSGAIDEAAAAVRAYHRQTGQELDTVALDVRVIRPTTTTCTHADYTIEINMGALPPGGNVSATEASQWIRAQVIDRQAPTLTNVAARADFIPTQTECLWEAIDYAGRRVPRHYNPNVIVSDNCATQTPPLMYDWKFTADDTADPCLHRGMVTMSWQASDGCNNAVAVAHPIRVWDMVGPRLMYPEKLKQCTTLSQRGMLCPDEFIREKLLEAFTDNCDEPTSFNVQPLWDQKQVELCRPKQQAGAIGKASLQCMPRSSNKDDTATCILVDNEWMRIQIPFTLTDSCDNQSDGGIFDLLIAPTERACTNYGYTFGGK